MIPQFEEFLYPFLVALKDGNLTTKEMKGYDDNYGYRHLIGQTIMYCGDPWKYSYNSPNLPVGDYYYIKNVDVYKGSSIKNTVCFR